LLTISGSLEFPCELALVDPLDQHSCLDHFSGGGRGGVEDLGSGSSDHQASGLINNISEFSLGTNPVSNADLLNESSEYHQPGDLSLPLWMPADYDLGPSLAPAVNQGVPSIFQEQLPILELDLHGISLNPPPLFTPDNLDLQHAPFAVTIPYRSSHMGAPHVYAPTYDLDSRAFIGSAGPWAGFSPSLGVSTSMGSWSPATTNASPLSHGEVSAPSPSSRHGRPKQTGPFLCEEPGCNNTSWASRPKLV